MKKKLSLGYVAVVVSMTLVLLIMGLVGCMMTGAQAARRSLTENLGVSVFLSDTLTESGCKALETKLRAESSVREWNYVSKEAAAADFEKVTGIEFLETLQSNPIPASFDLKLRGDSLNLEEVEELASRMRAWGGVQQVGYGEQVVRQMASTFSSVSMLLVGFCVALLFVAVVLIYNTINLAVATHSQAIRTMKLVGATRSFIRRPYLVRAVVQGALSGVLGGVLLVLALHLVASNVPLLNTPMPAGVLVTICSLQIVSGIIICLIFTSVSVNKLINKR